VIEVPDILSNFDDVDEHLRNIRLQRLNNPHFPFQVKCDVYRRKGFLFFKKDSFVRSMTLRGDPTATNWVDEESGHDVPARWVKGYIGSGVAVMYSLTQLVDKYILIYEREARNLELIAKDSEDDV